MTRYAPFALLAVLLAAPAAAQDAIPNPVVNPSAEAACQYRELDSQRPVVIRIDIVADRGWENHSGRTVEGIAPGAVERSQRVTVTVTDGCTGHSTHTSWTNDATGLAQEEALVRLGQALRDMHLPILRGEGGR